MKTLFKPPHASPVNLTPDQTIAWDLLRTTVGGVTAAQIGIAVHTQSGASLHSADVQCNWCAARGLSLMRSKALKPLVIRRRATGRWEPRDPKHRAADATAQGGEIPW
jgi:hypothetical protein